MTLSSDGVMSSAYVFAAGALFGCAAGGAAGYTLGELAEARRHAAQKRQVEWEKSVASAKDSSAPTITPQTSSTPSQPICPQGRIFTARSRLQSSYVWGSQRVWRWPWVSSG